MTANLVPEILRQLGGSILHERDDLSAGELFTTVQWFNTEAQAWFQAKTQDANPDPLPEFRLLAQEVAQSLRAEGFLSPEGALVYNEALEVLRRTERALGQSIKVGQDAGLISSRKSPKLPPGPQRDYYRGAVLIKVADRNLDSGEVRSVGDFYPPTLGKGGGETGRAGRLFAELDDDEWEKVLAEARATGFASRIHVVRVMNEWQAASRGGYTSVLAGIKDLAEQGYTSEQIGEALGYSEDNIRRRASAANIVIPGDEARRRTRKTIDPMRIVRETAIGLEGTVSALDLLDLSALSPDDPELAQWATSIQRSLRSITKMSKKLKEIVNG